MTKKHNKKKSAAAKHNPDSWVRTPAGFPLVERAGQPGFFFPPLLAGTPIHAVHQTAMEKVPHGEVQQLYNRMLSDALVVADRFKKSTKAPGVKVIPSIHIDLVVTVRQNLVREN